MASNSSDSSQSSNSALTNVAPPTALPSFLTSPLPSSAPSPVPPPGPPSPHPNTTAPPPSPYPAGSPHVNTTSTNVVAPGQSFTPQRASVPHPPNTSIPPFTSSTTPSVSLKANVTQLPPCPASSSSSTSLTGGSSGGTVASELPSFPPTSKTSPTPPSNVGESGMGSQSFQPPQPYYPTPPESSNPVTSQPQPPSSTLGPGGSEGPGWLGWIKGTVSNVGHRVAEKAKTSMDSMITTLDPQMKEFIHSGGDMDIIVASDKEVKIGAVREAFQRMFGKATVCGMKAEAPGIAAQPVGFEAALSSAEGRINSLRSSGQIHPQHPIVAVENFIVEFQTDCWFDLGLLLLDDPGEDIILQTYTQVTPIPPDFVNQARSSTPDDYPYKDTGFAVTVGQIASQSLQVPHTMWQETLTGVSRREALVLAGRTLAGLYRSRLPSYH